MCIKIASGSDTTVGFRTIIKQRNKLKLIPKSETEKEIEEYFIQKQIDFKKKEEFLQVGLKDSMSAVPILNAICTFIEGFEMVQGSMDDVFLNVTGRTLEG